MLGMAPDYDHLPVINKVEVFEYALDSTSGEDLHKVGKGRGCYLRGNMVVVCLIVCEIGGGGCFKYALDSTSGEDLHKVRVSGWGGLLCCLERGVV
jgi:hypothetical protein